MLLPSFSILQPYQYNSMFTLRLLLLVQDHFPLLLYPPWPIYVEVLLPYTYTLLLRRSSHHTISLETCKSLTLRIPS